MSAKRKLGICAAVILGSASSAMGPIHAAPVDTAQESKFTPIAPCQIVNTKVAGGKLAPNSERSFVAAGDAGFLDQGGKSGGCGIPDSATAIQVVALALEAEGKGTLRAVADNLLATPTSLLTTYVSSYNVSGAGLIGVDTAGAFDFKVKNVGSRTHLAINVVGYFVAPMFARVSSTGSLINGSRVVSVVRISTGRYQVTFDRLVAGCAVAATSTGNQQTDIWTSAGGSVVDVDLEEPDVENVQRDDSFYLTVTC